MAEGVGMMSVSAVASSAVPSLPCLDLRLRFLRGVDASLAAAASSSGVTFFSSPSALRLEPLCLVLPLLQQRVGRGGRH